MGTFTDENPSPLSTQGWRPTFFDGFNAPYLDRAAWPLLQWGWGSNGAYRLDPAAVTTWGGELAINTYSTPDGWVSGGMQQGWNGQRYGRYEVRAQIDKGQGTSDALLLWPTADKGGWETDIFESRNGDRTINPAVLHRPTDAQVYDLRYDSSH